MQSNQEDIKVIKNTNDRLMNQLEEQKITIASLKKKQENTKSTNYELMNQLAKEKEKITGLKEEIENAKVESDELRKQVEDPPIQVVQLERKVANLETIIALNLRKGIINDNIAAYAIPKKSDKFVYHLALIFSDVTRGACTLRNYTEFWRGKVPGLFSISFDGGLIKYDCMTDKGKRSVGDIFLSDLLKNSVLNEPNSSLFDRSFGDGDLEAKFFKKDQQNNKLFLLIKLII